MINLIISTQPHLKISTFYVKEVFVGRVCKVSVLINKSQVEARDRLSVNISLVWMMVSLLVLLVLSQIPLLITSKIIIKFKSTVRQQSRFCVKSTI